MSIQSISANNPILASTPLPNLSSVTSATNDIDGDQDGSRAPRAPGGGGKFVSAIEQALSQLGIASPATSTSGTTTADSSTTTPTDPSQALGAFMQNLFAALHNAANPAGAATQGTTGSSGNDSVTGGVAGASGHHHHHHGGSSKLEGDLQTLVQQLSSSSGSNTGTSSGSSGTNSGNASLDALQQSFNQLLTADGVSSSSATLSNFLQTISQSLQGAPSTGNVVATKV